MQVTVDGVPYLPACASASRIGIAATTHNRADVLKRAIEQHQKHRPAGALARMRNAWNKTLTADYAVGEAFGGRVIYSCYSLVDHADIPTVERHPDSAPRKERRRAWRLA